MAERCSIEGCESFRIVARGWCCAHYHRWTKYGSPVGKPPPRPPRQWPECVECGRSVRNVSRGMCKSCYEKWRYHKDPDLARDRNNRRLSSPTDAVQVAARRPMVRTIQALTKELGRRPHRHELPPEEQERLRVRDRAAYNRAIERRRELMRRRTKANAADYRRRATAWRIANPEKARAGSATKKARKRAAPGTLSGAAWVAILDVHRCCYYCGVSGVRLEQEHMTPLVRGGHHSPINVVPACGPCNRHKHTLTAWEFADGYQQD